MKLKELKAESPFRFELLSFPSCVFSPNMTEGILPFHW